MTRGRYEGSIKSGRDGSHFPKLDFIDLGLAYLQDKANLSAVLSLNPQKLSVESSEVHLGLSKSFGDNLSVKTKYALLSGVGTYHAHYRANPDCSLAYTLQVAHRAKGGVFNGFWGYPFNFGVQVNVNV